MTKTTFLSIHHSRAARMTLLVTAAAALAACSSAVKYDAPDASFQGRVAPADTPVIYPGTLVKLAGNNFKPGQEVQVLYQGQSVTGKPVVADAEGKFTTQTQIPANAAVGTHPLVVSVTNPAATSLLNLKVSPDIALSGADKFNIASVKAVPGLYQVAYSAKNNAIYVTSAVGRPPVKRSELSKYDANTLKEILRVSANEAPNRKAPDGTEQPGGLYAVYGVGVDDVNGNVWVTNTRQNTVAVYRQSDLALLKQFEPGALAHGFSVAVDSRTGKVFATSARSNKLGVFDAAKLEKIKEIELPGVPSARPGPGGAPAFASMMHTLDEASGKLFVAGASGEVAVVNTHTNAVEKVFKVDGVDSGSGIAYDAANNRVLIVGQSSDNLVIANANDGKVIHNVKVGGGSLYVAFEAASQLAYVSNRTSGTLTVVNTSGQIVANLDAAPLPNQVANGPAGVVYVVNKGQATNDDSDRIQRIQFKK